MQVAQMLAAQKEVPVPFAYDQMPSRLLGITQRAPCQSAVRMLVLLLEISCCICHTP